MLAPSAEIIQVLSVFAHSTTAPTFNRMLVLICGAILSPAQRTIGSCLRAMGLEYASDFGAYHRVLNRARWSPLCMSRILLGLILKAFVPRDRPLVLLIDDTLERRSGKRITYKSRFRDAVLSMPDQIAYAVGIRWLCVCALVEVPWCRRPWALPFLVVPVLSEKRCQKLGRPYRSLTEWAERLIGRVRRWCPDKEIVVAGDGAFACTRLVDACQAHQEPVVLVSRLRKDAVLHAPPNRVRAIRPEIAHCTLIQDDDGLGARSVGCIKEPAAQQAETVDVEVGGIDRRRG